MSNEKYIANDGEICPHCGSDHVRAGELSRHNDAVYADCSCGACESNWTDEYKLTGYTELHTPKEPETCTWIVPVKITAPVEMSGRCVQWMLNRSILVKGDEDAENSEFKVLSAQIVQDCA